MPATELAAAIEATAASSDQAALDHVAAKPADAEKEPEYEEVWRPRRRTGGDRDFRSQDRQRPDRQRHGNRGAEGQPAGGEGERRSSRSDNKGGGNRGNDRRRGNSPGGDRTVAAQGGSPAPTGDQPTPPQAEAGQSTNMPSDRPFGCRPSKGSGPSGGRPQHGHRGGKGGGGAGGDRGPRRDDRDRDRNRGGERQRFSAAPDKKRNEIDPNSPFAALSQLKAQLEKRPDGESKS